MLRLVFLITLSVSEPPLVPSRVSKGHRIVCCERTELLLLRGFCQLSPPYRYVRCRGEVEVDACLIARVLN